MPSTKTATGARGGQIATLALALTATALITPALAAPAVPAPSRPEAADTVEARADSGTPGYRVRPISVDVMTGPDRDTACTIAADLYVPDGVSKKRKAPAVLTSNGFGGSKDDNEVRSYGAGFAMEGYVVLAYSGLGFGGSGCKISLDDPDIDGEAGAQLVDVLAGTKTYTDASTGESKRLNKVRRNGPGDPRVGMIGGSYGGQNQFAIASKDPRVDALIPLITWNDLAYALAPDNSSIAPGSSVSYSNAGVQKRLWTTLFFAVGIANGLEQYQADPFRNLGCPNFVEDACRAKTQMDALGYGDETTVEFARHASVANYYDAITAPTLLGQGQADTLFNLQEATATFKALKKRGVPVSMMWQHWGHSNGGTPLPGESTKSGTNVKLTTLYQGRRFLNWMDHWVRGDTSAPLGPEFSYYRDWIDTSKVAGSDRKKISRAYQEKKRFSTPLTTELYLSGADRLVSTKKALVAGSASYANAAGAPTSYTEISALEGQSVNGPVTDQEGTFVAYTSPPLAKKLNVVGAGRLKVHLAAPSAAATQNGGPGGQLVLFAKLYDVAPDGTILLKHRLISPVRVADVSKPVRVELPAIVHQFAQGHRLRVVLAASDAAYSANNSLHPVTVSTSPDKPSRLKLPALNTPAFK